MMQLSLTSMSLTKNYSVFYFNTKIKNQKENAKEYVLEGRKQKPKYSLGIIFD